MIQAYENRIIDPAKPVRVYRNLNKKGVVYSVQQGGKVVAYATDITLKQCRCVVKESQRQQVIAKRCRQVHAWVEGYLTESPNEPEAYAEMSYNPYKFGHFYYVGSDAPVWEAARMQFNDHFVKVMA